jgi:hypothetical protein
MPGNANDGLNAERFAALWAGCDAGNANEAEALSKFRLLRRMVIAENLRIVDAMGRADVMRALDAQLKPVREESLELKAAFLQVAQLAELANKRQELIVELQQELVAVSCPGISSQPARRAQPVSSGELVNGGLVAALAIIAALLMLAALFQMFQ